MRLADRVAIVTGSGQGIGHAVARACAAEGARVVVAEVKKSRMERTVSEIRQAGGVDDRRVHRRRRWLDQVHAVRGVDGGWIESML